MSNSIKIPANDGEQHFDLTSWSIFIFALSLIVLCLAQVIYRLNLPTDGWSAQPNFFGPEQRLVFDRNLSSLNSPLSSGDVLLAVQGQPVEEILQHALMASPQPPPNWKLGQTIDYTVGRDGKTLTVQVQLDQRPAWPVISSVPGTLVNDPSVFPSLLIGLFLFLLRPRNRAARLLLLITAGFFASDAISHPVSGMLIGVTDLFYVGAYWPALFFDTLIWNFIIGPIYIHLFLVFPVRALPVRRYPRLTFAVLYSFAPAMLLLAFLLHAGNPLAFWSAWTTFSEVDYFMILGAVIVAMGHALLKEQEPTHRAQIRWVAAGTLVTSLGAVSGGLLAILGLQERYPFLSLFLFRLPFLAFPIGVAVAVLRHRMFDIDVIINRTLVYVPLTAILAGLFAASISLSQRLFISFTGQQSDVATVLTTLLVVAAFTPIKDRLQGLVDKRFKEGPDPSKRLRAFEQEVRTRVGAVESHQAVRRFLQEATLAFGATSGEGYIGSGSELKLVCAIGELKGDPALKAPIETDGQRFGVILLGQRAKGLSYGTEETDMLNQVASTVARAIQEDAEMVPAGGELS
jgi:hypothetical protein